MRYIFFDSIKRTATKIKNKMTGETEILHKKEMKIMKIKKRKSIEKKSQSSIKKSNWQ